MSPVNFPTRAFCPHVLFCLTALFLPEDGRLCLPSLHGHGTSSGIHLAQGWMVPLHMHFEVTALGGGVAASWALEWLLSRVDTQVFPQLWQVLALVSTDLAAAAVKWPPSTPFLPCCGLGCCRPRLGAVAGCWAVVVEGLHVSGLVDPPWYPRALEERPQSLDVHQVAKQGHT